MASGRSHGSVTGHVTQWPMIGDLASMVEAMTATRDEAVANAQQRTQSRNMRQQEKWPSPPDPTRNLHDRLGTAEHATVRSEQQHFLQFKVVPQPQVFTDPWCLK